MVRPADIRIRRAAIADAPAVGALHADSWRHHYRGAYTDAFLDGDVVADREATWSSRLADEAAGRQPTATFIAHHPDSPERPVGFAHVAFRVDPRWGSLLDNLHISYSVKRSGIGSLLIREVAAAAIADGTSRALHLYVLEQNTDAQAFYQTRGGRFVESSFVPDPGGVAGRLIGTPKRQLYVWEDATALLGAG